MTGHDTTAEHLKIILENGGLAGRVAEVRRFPGPLLSRLALFFNTTNRLGQLPPNLERARVSQILKPNAVSRADFRPVSVMSVIYWLWAAARLQDVMVW